MNRGPAPNSRALSPRVRSADLRCCGVPFLTLSSSFMMRRSLASSRVSSSSSTSASSLPKYCASSGLNSGSPSIDGRRSMPTATAAAAALPAPPTACWSLMKKPSCVPESGAGAEEESFRAGVMMGT